LKRLRQLEPGDPQWAADLGSLYAFALLRGAAPDATPGTKQLQAAVTADLEKSNDAAVLGYVGITMYNGGRMTLAGAQAPEQAHLRTLGESLLQRAAELNPKNPGWSNALSAPAPKTSAALGALITSTLAESDLWPSGAVQEMMASPGALRLPSDKLKPVPHMVVVGAMKVVERHVTPPAAGGAGCSVQFDALVGREGRVERLQVAGFDHLNIPFEASARDWLREAHYEPTMANGKPVEVVTRFEEKCPPLTPVILGGVPGGVAGGVPGGVLGGILGSVPPPTPPPPTPVRTQSPDGAPISVGGKTMEGMLIRKVAPIYPPVARQGGISGTVSLAITVNEEGKVESVERTAGHPLLTPAAIDAVKQWVYKPTELMGKPVKVKSVVSVTFTLGQ